MAKEYKFMFDRQFDVPEEEDPADSEFLSDKATDGLPSISELLDTLNEHIQKNSIQEEPFVSEPPPKETKEETVQPEPEPPRTEEPPSSPPPPEPEQKEPVKVAPPPPAPVIPAFSEKQIEEMKKKAWEEGRLNGLEEGREAAWQEAMVSIEKQNSDTLSAIDASLKRIFKNLEESSQTAFTAAMDLALAVCQKAVPTLCEANASAEIRSLLEKNLHFLTDEPKISLRLNPFLADKIKPVLADLIKKESYGGKIVVVRDDSLPVGDCRIEWKNGGLEKNTQDVLNHTEELLKLYTHAAPAKEPSADQIGEQHNG